MVRLRAGESELAVHPRCGTMLATAGVLAGLSAFATTLGRPKSRWERLPLALLAATAAVVVAQPLGLAVQKHVTTMPDLKGTTVKNVTRQQIGRLVVHRVEIEHK